MTSELQRDIAEIEAALEKVHSYQREDWKRLEAAWQRLKPRLADQSSAVASTASSPDREQVGRLISLASEESIEARERILLARIAELEADTGRYRWLREQGDYGCTEKDGYGGQRLMTGEQLDAAIDAAREAKP